MEHPGDDDWLDYARNLVHGQTAVEMSRHAELCEQCRRILELWQAVVTFSGNMRMDEPREEVIRFVRDAFSLARNRQTQRVRVAEMVLDTFAATMNEGILRPAGNF